MAQLALRGGGVSGEQLGPADRLGQRAADEGRQSDLLKQGPGLPEQFPRIVEALEARLDRGV